MPLRNCLPPILFALTIGISMTVWGSEAAPGPSVVTIEEAVDLRKEAATMQAGRIPMMLLVSQDHCPFCVQIKNEILNPMLKSGDYHGRVLIREIVIDAGTSLQDFAGNKRQSIDFARDYGVDLTPTLLYLDHHGRELAKRLIGLNTPEMFSFYVDSALEDAIDKLRQPTR